MTLQGKVAVVTGGSRGIGREIAITLARAGAGVVVNYQRETAAAEDVLQAIREFPGAGEAMVFQADVTKLEECEKMVKAALDHLGRIDILVNNAGVRRDTLLALMKEDDWDLVLDTNLKGMFNCCKAVLRPLLKQKSGGRIINISSVVGLAGNSGQANYAAAKGGVIAFTKSLAKELGKRAITVNAIAPGFIETEMTEQLADAVKDKVLTLVALERYGNPAEVAETVLFLSGEGASYITGAVISVDGGLSL